MQITNRVVDVRRVPASSIKPSPFNWRTHPESQMAALRSVLEKIGFAGVELARKLDDGSLELIDGHARAEIVGDGEVYVAVTDLTEAEAKDLILTFDPIAAMAGANNDRLAALLAEVKPSSEAIGKLHAELAARHRLLPGLGEVAQDEAPAPPDAPVTQRGQIWQLGDHRLMCGDSGSVEDLDRLLHGAVIHLANTDPPYNVKVEPRSNNAIAAGLSSFGPSQTNPMNHHQSFDHERQVKRGASTKATHAQLRAKDRPLANDFVTDESFDKMLDAWFGNIARVLVPGRGFYIWGGYANVANYPAPLQRHGLYFSQAIIWVKCHPVLTRKDFMGNHEWCFYGWKEGAAHEFFAPPNTTDVWTVKKVPPQRMVHLTEKPVELAAMAMSYSSRKGENVLDLFGGSGSTLIAAEQLGRHAYLMELDPLYCDVIVKRWEAITGRKAEIADAGRPAVEAHA